MKAQIIAIAIAAATPMAAARAAEDTGCAAEVARQEAAVGTPGHLLSAVALVESGRRKDGKAPVAWPWTLNADGQAYFFESKAEAAAAARKFLREGSRSLDVGCMQVNLQSHPSAFASLEEALDPAANVAYAAGFLKRLFGENGSWASAVGKYHSRTPGLFEPYRDRVIAIWQLLAGGRGLLPTPPRVSAPLGHVPSYPGRGFDEADPIKALLYYRQEAQKRPRDAQALFGRAVAIDHLVREGQYPVHQARLAYAQAVAAAPGSGGIALERLFQLIDVEPAEQRIPLLEELYRMTGGPAAVPARLAQSYEAKGDLAAALFYCRQAVRLDPTNRSYRQRLASLRRRNGGG